MPVIDAKPRKGFDLGDYVEVKDRIRMFYEAFPDGRLITADVKVTREPDDTPRVWVKALAYRSLDDPFPGHGWSWMVLPGTTSYTRGSELENTETSAWGRAIGALGIGIERSIASANEVQAKSTNALVASDPAADGLIGVAELPKDAKDLELRQTPDGPITTFRLTEGRKGVKVILEGSIVETAFDLRAEWIGKRVTVWGTVTQESFDKRNAADGSIKTIYYQVVHGRKLQTPDWTLPAPVEADDPFADLDF